MEYDFRFVEELITQYNISYNDMISIKLGMYKKNIEKLIKDRVHTSKITEPKAVGGMWCTYVYDEGNTNHRKCIQARTEEGFYKSLYLHYFPNGIKYKKISICGLFEETIQYKKEILLNDEETIKKFRLTYKKYYKGTNFEKKPIDKITSSDCEDFFNSIIKNAINKQEIAGGPVVQVSNFGTSKELNIRFKSKDGGLLMTREEFSKSPLAKKTTSTSQVDKFNARYKGASNTMTYEDYIKEYQAGIAYFEVFAPIYLNDVFEKFQNPDGSIDMKAIEELNPDLLKMIGYRIPTEDKYSCAPLKIVGFLPREAGDAIMLPNDITLLTGSDFDIDKEYLMRKDIPITLRDKKDIHNDIIAELTKNKTLSKEKVKELNDSIRRFLDNPDPKLLDFKQAEDRVLWKLYKKFAYKAEAPTEGRTYRNNKIVDMTYEVLTHETVADKILNPGGFDTQKRMGYLVSAYRNPANNYSWEELEAISKQPDGIDRLKELCYTEKNLCFIDTHIQFYKQNNAAGSLIGTFAVHKTAHAILESDEFQIDVDSICKPFVIDGMTFGFSMTVDPRYDRKGNLIGKTLGSLVASAADAVKDPILNLMNINSNTSSILNTLIRLGMDFDTAALFLSQTAITRILEQHAKQNITKVASLNKVIKPEIGNSLYSTLPLRKIKGYLPPIVSVFDSEQLRT